MDPDWLKKMKAEGRVKEQGIKMDALPPWETASVERTLERVVRGASESQFQKCVIMIARAHGWRVAHFRAVPVRRPDGSVQWQVPVAADGEGFPDLELVRGKRLIKAELKVKGNTRTPAQVAWGDAYIAAGVEYHVWYPEDWSEIVSALSRTD